MLNKCEIKQIKTDINFQFITFKTIFNALEKQKSKNSKFPTHLKQVKLLIYERFSSLSIIDFSISKEKILFFNPLSVFKNIETQNNYNILYKFILICKTNRKKKTDPTKKGEKRKLMFKRIINIQLNKKCLVVICFNTMCY